MVNAKQLETENRVKQLLGAMKKEPDIPVINAQGISEQALKEAVENLGMGLKSELLSMFEEDKHMKNVRFQEVFNLMESNKNLVNEHIGQQFEKLKALMKAYTNQEIAERIEGDNAIMALINKRLDGMDSLFDSKLKDEMQIMNDKIQ